MSRTQPLSAAGFSCNRLFRSLPIRSTVPRLDPDVAANSQATRMSLPLSRRTLKSATYRNVTPAVSARSISTRLSEKGWIAGRGARNIIQNLDFRRALRVGNERKERGPSK